MASNYIGRSSGSAETVGEGADTSSVGGSIWLLVWLSAIASTIGLVSLLSYSLNGSELIRATAPSFAAWWEANQFYFMEGGATALGLLLGMALGNSIMADLKQRSRARLAALVLGIIAFAPLIQISAVAARLGWNGRETSLASWLISREGYEIGRHVDRVLITAVYCLKTVAFGLLCGLGLMAIACAAVIILDSANAELT